MQWEPEQSGSQSRALGMSISLKGESPEYG
jgi:hypothetical protein